MLDYNDNHNDTPKKDIRSLHSVITSLVLALFELIRNFFCATVKFFEKALNEAVSLRKTAIDSLCKEFSKPDISNEERRYYIDETKEICREHDSFVLKLGRIILYSIIVISLTIVFVICMIIKRKDD